MMNWEDERCVGVLGLLQMNNRVLPASNLPVSEAEVEGANHKEEPGGQRAHSSPLLYSQRRFPDMKQMEIGLNH